MIAVRLIASHCFARHQMMSRTILSHGTPRTVGGFQQYHLIKTVRRCLQSLPGLFGSKFPEGLDAADVLVVSTNV